MKQRIEVSIIAPSDYWSLNILSVHEVANQLVVVAKAKSPLLSHDSEEVVVAAQVVSTSSNTKLPVVCYLTGISQENIDSNNHVGNYGERHGIKLRNGKKTSTFIPIKDVSDIADLVAQGSCLYQPRSDGMTALRIARYDRAHTESPTQMQVQTPMQAAVDTVKPDDNHLRCILNLYTVVEDGVISIVLENTRLKREKKSFRSLSDLIGSAHSDGHSTLDLRNQFAMQSDDALVFRATMNGDEEEFVTTATEFSLPVTEIGTALSFLRFLKCVIDEAYKSDAKMQAYTLVLTGENSVLSQFRELFIARKVLWGNQLTNVDYYDESYDEKEEGYNPDYVENTIVYPHPINLTDFCQHRNVMPDPNQIFDDLVGELVNAPLPEYAGLQADLKQYLAFGMGAVFFPHLALTYMLGEDVTMLSGDEPQEQRLSVAKRIEAKLASEAMLNKVGSLLDTLHHHGVNSLIRGAMNCKAHDGGNYNPRYTEFTFLINADFCEREDGRLSLKHDNNVGYRIFYAKGAHNYEKFAAELIHLGDLIGIKFAEGCDFHKEIIFTEESSLKLKALGLHLNQTNLRQRLALAANNNLQASATTNDLSSAGNADLAAVTTGLPVAEQTAPVVNPVASVASAAVKPVVGQIPAGDVARQLREQYPESNAVLRVMQKAGLFTDNLSANNALFADLILACAALKQTSATLEKRDTLSSLVMLYKLLDGKNGLPGPLTLKAHKTIIERLVPCNYLQRMSDMIQLIGDLDAKQAEKLVSAARHLMYIADVVKDFDFTNDSFLYAFQHVESRFRLFMLCEDLKKQREHGSLNWLRKEDFKVVVDYTADDRHLKILAVLRSLQEADAIASHRDRYLQNISVTPILIELGWRKLLTKENIDLALANPDFVLAERMCLTNHIIGTRANFSLEDDHILVQGLLAQPELTRAFKTMQDMFEQNRENGYTIFHDEYAKDLKALLKIAGLAPPSDPDEASDLYGLIKSGLSFFNQVSGPRKIGEYLDEMKEKYAYNEPVLELADPVFRRG